MRLYVFLCLFLGLVCHAAPAQRQNEDPPPTTATAKPVPTGRITGQVLCEDTRRPARGAVVMVQRLSGKEGGAFGGPSSMARTGSNGVYTLRNVPVGAYAVIALLPGYLSPFDGLVVNQGGGSAEKEILARLKERASVNVRPGADSTRDLVLERGAAISGQVLYPDGAPATQATILLEPTARQPARDEAGPAIDMGMIPRTFLIHQQSGTDDQGHFRLSGLAPGTYRIAAVPVADSANASGAYAAVFSGMVADPAGLHVYAGNTLHQKDAKVYDLRAGDEVNDVTITLPIDSLYAVSGSVTAKDGRTLNRAELKLTDGTDSALVFSTTLEADGTFRFASVPAGSYLLHVTSGGIMRPNPNLPPGPGALASGTPMATFADKTVPVLVKDSPLEGVQVTLDETALPKEGASSVQAPIPIDPD